MFSMHVFSNFGAWAIFGMDACHVFPQGVLAIILLGEEGVCVCVCVCVCVYVCVCLVLW